MYIPKRIENNVLKIHRYTYVHNRIIHSSPNVDAIKVSINILIDKQNGAYTYNGILFRLKEGKEILIHATIWMNLEDIMLSKISHKKTNTI